MQSSTISRGGSNIFLATNSGWVIKLFSIARINTDLKKELSGGSLQFSYAIMIPDKIKVQIVIGWSEIVYLFM